MDQELQNFYVNSNNKQQKKEFVENFNNQLGDMLNSLNVSIIENKPFHSGSLMQQQVQN